jgi:hypothetical protein
MSFTVCILDLAERRPDQGLYEFCAPRRIAIAHGYETFTQTLPGVNVKVYAVFESQEEYIMFKLRYL